MVRLLISGKLDVDPSGAASLLPSFLPILLPPLSFSLQDFAFLSCFMMSVSPSFPTPLLCFHCYDRPWSTTSLPFFHSFFFPSYRGRNVSSSIRREASLSTAKLHQCPPSPLLSSPFCSTPIDLRYRHVRSSKRALVETSEGGENPPKSPFPRGTKTGS